MDKQRIYAQKSSTLNEADRLDLARLLIKAGYAVRIKKEKAEGRTVVNYIVEYWTDDAT